MSEQEEVAARPCLTCGGPLPLAYPNRRHCSKRCRQNRPAEVARRMGAKNTAPCVQCGRLRINPREGDLCQGCAKPKRRLMPCPRCGAQFWPWANRKHRRKFCCKPQPKPKTPVVARVVLTPEERRERARVRSLSKYRANRRAEIARVSNYKKRNPDKNSNWAHRRRARSVGGFIGPVDLGAVKASRKGCLYCCRPITPTTAQADHVIAIALGGEHSMRNLVAACGSCNSRKQDKPLSEWLSTLDPGRRAIVERLCAKRGLNQGLLPVTVRRPWRCGCVPGQSTCPGHTKKREAAA